MFSAVYICVYKKKAKNVSISDADIDKMAERLANKKS